MGARWLALAATVVAGRQGKTPLDCTFLSIQPRRIVSWGVREAAAGVVLGFLALVILAVAGILAGSRFLPSWTAAFRGLLLAVSELGLLVGPWLVVLRRRRATWHDLGLRPFNAVVGCLAASAALIVVLVGSVAWGLVLQRLGWRGQPSVRDLFGPGWQGLALAVLAVVGVAPVAEEVLFRGLVFPALRQRWGLCLGAGVSSLLFAAFHLSPASLPSLFFTGLILSLVCHYCDSLWPALWLHMGVNLMAVLAAYLV